MPVSLLKECLKYLPGTGYKIVSLIVLVLVMQESFSKTLDSSQSNAPRIKKTGQLLVVITDNLHQRSGKLYFFQKVSGKWKKRIEAVPIMVGAYGMAWSDDLTGLFKGFFPRKKEGDLCSPAGVFALNEAFAFDSIPLSVKLIVLGKGSVCIDDLNSPHYNEIIDSLKFKKDWNSEEKMRSVPGYKYGLIIDNDNGKRPGKNGSCIFVHIWSAQGRSTAGCTAMKEEDLLRILRLLDKKYFPVIVQLPLDTYNKYKKPLGFPAL